jgi:cephalosporin hydroxylase
MKKMSEILSQKDESGFAIGNITDKASEHSYDILYDSILSKYRNKEICLLEIGIWHGGSALLWQEYFPKGKLVFLDIESRVSADTWKSINKDKFDFHLMDAFTNEGFEKVKELYPNGFDIIIDDAPHTLESQIFTIQNYTKLLRKGGILVIEDIQHFDNASEIMQLIGDIPHKSCEVIDLRPIKNRYDDIVIVVKK